MAWHLNNLKEMNIIVSLLLYPYWYLLSSVIKYSSKTAILTLEHGHPPGNKLKALVDIQLLVNSLKSYETRFGEWINVIGYIQAPQQNPGTHSDSLDSNVYVQALVLWSAGPMKIDGYENSLDQQKSEYETNGIDWPNILKVGCLNIRKLWI